MSVLIALGATLALYATGLVRASRRGRQFSTFATVCFVLGIACLAAVLVGPMDDLSDASLSWHMVQHLVVMNVAAPLLLAGAPVRLALSALPPRAAIALSGLLNSRVARAATQPAVAWLQFAAVLYATHFSPLYELALENESVHACMHLLFLFSALVFWTPLLAVAPAPHAPSHPVRLLAIFLALPMSAFLGFTFYVAGHVFYPHYAAYAGALADQKNAGEVMWLTGATPLFAAFLWLFADWGARERRFGAISDAAP